MNESVFVFKPKPMLYGKQIKAVKRNPDIVKKLILMK